MKKSWKTIRKQQQQKYKERKEKSPYWFSLDITQIENRSNTRKTNNHGKKGKKTQNKVIPHTFKNTTRGLKTR